MPCTLARAESTFEIKGAPTADESSPGTARCWSSQSKCSLTLSLASFDSHQGYLETFGTLAGPQKRHNCDTSTRSKQGRSLVIIASYSRPRRPALPSSSLPHPLAFSFPACLAACCPCLSRTITFASATLLQPCLGFDQLDPLPPLPAHAVFPDLLPTRPQRGAPRLVHKLISAPEAGLLVSSRVHNTFHPTEISPTCIAYLFKCVATRFSTATVQPPCALDLPIDAACNRLPATWLLHTSRSPLGTYY